VDALGAEKVRCLIMPSEYSSFETMADAEKICKNLNLKYDIIPISPIVKAYEESLASIFDKLDRDITEENLQSRIRGTINMALSNKFGNIVLVTGNKSECAVGYCTLYGDTAGSLAVISDLYKHEVYALSEYINRNKEIIPKSIIEREPSAELRPDQKDTDSLPNYDVLDKILNLFIEEGNSIEDIVKKGFDESIVKQIVNLFYTAQFKREQYPMGICITGSSFMKGNLNDLPLMNKFKV